MVIRMVKRGSFWWLLEWLKRGRLGWLIRLLKTGSLWVVSTVV